MAATLFSEIPIDPRSLEALTELVQGRRTLVLTGAGCSTESGIPDYRGPGTRDRARNPIQHREFLSSHAARVRYWARSTIGWPHFRAFEPNAGHRALAQLEHDGWVEAVLTQNVDRLHQRAGSENVVELHGALADVRCLGCGAAESRDALQSRLLELNPGFREAQARAEVAPDGDAELTAGALENFRIPSCGACGDGVLKPAVVFFGDNVPPERVARAFDLLDRAHVLLVLGTSLAVYSGYRFVLKAAEKRLGIGIVNLGESRGDSHAHVMVQGTVGQVLPALARALR